LERFLWQLESIEEWCREMREAYDTEVPVSKLNKRLEVAKRIEADAKRRGEPDEAAAAVAAQERLEAAIERTRKAA
jgi:biopolymer transport protein ExbB/TolQ